MTSTKKIKLIEIFQISRGPGDVSHGEDDESGWKAQKSFKMDLVQMDDIYRYKIILKSVHKLLPHGSWGP